MLSWLRMWGARGAGLQAGRRPPTAPASPPRSDAPPEVQARIDALAPWFHSIDLGNGIRIQRDARFGSPDYPARLWQWVGPSVPRDLTGMRTLDVGCNGGFFSLALDRRGAAYVLGIEAVSRHLEQARLVRELSGRDIDLRLLSIYDLSSELGQFDLALCLGVVYHLRHPLLGLERLAAVTRGTLIVESAVVAPAPIRAPADFGPRAQSLAFMEYPPLGPEADAYRNWFIPSMECLKSWIELFGFTVVSAAVRGDRGLVVARRAGSPG